MGHQLAASRRSLLARPTCACRRRPAYRHVVAVHKRFGTVWAFAEKHRKKISGIVGTLLLSAKVLLPDLSLAYTQELAAPEVQQSSASGLLPLPTEFPALADIKELPISTATLSNGLRVFLIEDHEVPVIKGSIAMQGGQRASPADKTGLASIALAVQRSGGSAQHPGEQLDDSLEMLAAGIEGGALPEATVLGFGCLKEDSAEVIGLLSELLTEPALPDDKLQLYKGQVLNLLEHRNDNASSIPRRELSKLLYGKDSVFARTPVPSQIESIGREDILRYIRQWQRPDSAIMGVFGDFDSGEMERMLENNLKGWKADPSSVAQPLPTSTVPEGNAEMAKLYLVDRPGATQATVAMGEVGVSIADPDAPALDVLNEILNSFGGRLFNEIRSKEGLAYSVSGGFGTSTVDHKGLFLAGGETAAAADFIAALESVLEDVTQTAPSERLLSAAKAKTLNSFVFNFSSTEAQLQRLIGFSLLGLPQDYLFSYRDKVQAVREEDVLAAAQRHLHPRQQQVVVVADAALTRQQLDSLHREVVPLLLN